MRSYFVFFACLFATSARADPPVVEGVRISGDTIHVTVSHPDTGWDHYADVWRVFAGDGTQIAERILLHPHVSEQPFTRSTPLALPNGFETLTIIASCTHGDRSAPFEHSLAD